MADRTLAEMIGAAPLPARPAGAAAAVDAWRAALPEGHALAGLARRPAVEALLRGVADGSPFLWRLAAADPDRLLGLLSRPPGITFAEVLGRLEALCGGAAPAAVMGPLRRARAEVALLVGLADLGGAWDLEAVCGALTRFADAAVRLAVEALLREAEAAGRLGAASGEPGAGCGLAVLAMGKGGAGELNYSSDIDLVLFFDPAAPRLAPGVPAAAFYARLAKGLVRLLGERTGEGYVLRVDLRLRPDPASTGVAVSWPAALHYYEASGQTWERAAFIKARPVAGDLELGAAFLRELAPFVWRRFFDYAALADIHAMKRGIDGFRGHGRVAVAGHDLKVGRGGIREVEFFAQTQQLVFGGRRPALRGARTLGTLDALAAEGWITPEAAAELGAAYSFLRRIEHRLQMVADEQTQRLPADPGALERLALFSGFSGRDGFEAALLDVLRTVERHYARLFERAPGGAGRLAFGGDTPDPGTVEALRAMGFARPAEAVETVRGWHFGRRPALRGGRARAVLARLVPDLLDAFARSGEPDAALAALDAALGRLPAAAELFGVLEGSAPLRQLYADTLGAAPRLAAAVAAHPHLLDVALDPQLGRDPPGAVAEARILEGPPDLESALDRARDAAREAAFPVGLALLSGAAEPRRAAEHYSDLAEGVVRGLLRRVEDDFARAHGRVPGGAFAVVAMGKLGSREMTASSDLDLLFVYDEGAQGAEGDGPRPLAAPRHYARLGQRLVGALTAATRRGALYGVDMRLRPSGNQGPLATRLSAFARHHAEQAETWERMALTRARTVAGAPALRARVEGAIRDAILRPPAPGLGAEVLALRALVEAGKPHGGPWDLKLAPGGQLDVEFLAQFLVLRHGRARPELLGLSTADVFAAAEGLLPEGARAALGGAARLLTDVTQILRLSVEGPFDPARAGAGLRRRLAGAAGLPDLATLERHLADARAGVRGAFAAVLGADG